MCYDCRVVNQNRPQMHVVTSDQEDAIRSGLEMSQLHDISLHVICSLHVKWNVRDHKYVFCLQTYVSQD